MIAAITGYLAGAKIDKETPIFRGVGNLSVLAPDGSFLFLGVSISDGIVLTFGDQTNDDVVFLAANYEPTGNESLSQLIFLEKAIFESWLLQNGNPPRSEEWCLIPFSDWIAANDSTKTRETNCFADATTFQVGCSTFIRHCTKMKQEKDPLFYRLLLIPQVDEEDDSKLNGH